MISDTQKKLLEKLSPDTWISGERLGEQIGMSRTAIWKHIRKIQALGLPIEHCKKGYRLRTPFIPLNPSAIRSALDKSIFAEIPDIGVFERVDSTNLHCKIHGSNTPVYVCCSEEQTAGRGRLGRQWLSPYGQNIYCSLSLTKAVALDTLTGLSLVVSLALRQALAQYIPKDDLVIKWPNDLLWNHKKLSGILVEINAEPHGSSQIIIGFGMNVHVDTKQMPLSAKPHCSLFDITHASFDRNTIIAECLNHLQNYLLRFWSHGFGHFLEEWAKFDYLYDKSIHVHQPNASHKGRAAGINEHGQLLLATSEGIQSISAGDASLDAQAYPGKV